MTFPNYRSVMELTDDEIIGLLKCVYPSMGTDSEKADYVEEINRNEDIIDISCMSAVDLEDDEIEENGKDYTWIDDHFQLSDFDGLEAYDFALSDKENLAVKQYLLACGCHYLLKDNPFL